MWSMVGSVTDYSVDPTDCNMSHEEAMEVLRVSTTEGCTGWKVAGVWAICGMILI